MSRQNKMIGGMLMPVNESFVFYASWFNTIEAYNKFEQQEMAKELAYAIVEYGVTGEITSENPIIIGIVNGMCKDLIDKSKSKYKDCVNNGKKGGRPKKYDDAEILRLHNLGLSNQDIADNLLCNIKTVERALKNYEEDDGEEI